MSLRVFHVLFIVLSIALSAMVGAWAVQGYRQSGELASLSLAVVFFLAGFAMVVYGVRFFRKLKELG